MPLETTYHVRCDNCDNYCGYLPVFSLGDALDHCKKLDWYQGEAKVGLATKFYFLCPNCKGDAGEHRVGDRG